MGMQTTNTQYKTNKLRNIQHTTSAWGCYEKGLYADAAKWARKLASLDLARAVWPLTLADRLPTLVLYGL
jgi:hypothetical protein